MSSRSSSWFPLVEVINPWNFGEFKKKGFLYRRSEIAWDFVSVILRVLYAMLIAYILCGWLWLFFNIFFVSKVFIITRIRAVYVFLPFPLFTPFGWAFFFLFAVLLFYSCMTVCWNSSPFSFLFRFSKKGVWHW